VTPCSCGLTASEVLAVRGLPVLPVTRTSGMIVALPRWSEAREAWFRCRRRRRAKGINICTGRPWLETPFGAPRVALEPFSAPPRGAAPE